jgi:hypothetical protein
MCGSKDKGDSPRAVSAGLKGRTVIPIAANPSVLAFFEKVSMEPEMARYLVVAFTMLAVLMAFRQIRRVMHQLRLANEAARTQQFHAGASATEAPAQRRPSNKDVWIS